MGNTCGDDDDDDDDDDLPEDVLIQILVCLPVKSLLRFKSVCKSWLSFIETPYFINLRTTTTTFKSSSSKFGSFIFHASTKWFMLSSVSGDEDIIGYDQVDYLGFPPCDFPLISRFDMHMVGSCNGLICIHESTHEVVSLWNPATRQFRILPKPIITIEEEGVDWFYDFVAFGFDVKTKDYKVVQFRCFKTPAEKWFSRVQVYSLSTDSWRLLEGIHYLPARPCDATFQNQGIYMNGCYFFVGQDESQVWLQGGGNIAGVCNNNSLMYSFDFTKEILTTMQFPDHDSRHDLILSCLGADKIALFMIQRNISIGGRVSQFHDCGLDYEYYDVWVLNEQPGSNCVNNESWTKLHSFRKLNRVNYYNTQPGCISNDGEFALISTRLPDGFSELQLFNLVTGEAKKDFPLGYDVIRSDVYTQSLVSIIGGKGAATTADSFYHRWKRCISNYSR